MQTNLSWDFFLNLPAEKEAYFSISQKRTFNKKELLYLQGDPPESVFYLLAGEIIITKVSSTGREVVVYMHKKGVLAGLPSALTGLPRTSTAQPLNYCIVQEAKTVDFKPLLTRYPALIERIMLQNYGSLSFMADQYLSAFSEDAETRLKKLLARLFSQQLLLQQQERAQDSISLQVTQDQLASSIGISRTRVNKLLQRLSTRGLIRLAAHKISFLDPDYFLGYLEMIPDHPDANRQRGRKAENQI